MKKKQIWIDKGIIFKNLKLNWSKTHAMLPTVYKLKDDIFRIFFGTRNNKNQSSIGYFDYDLKNFVIKKKSFHPILKKGNLGAFDDNGVLPSSIIKFKNKNYLFYIGWRPGGTTRYSLIAGLSQASNINRKFLRLKESQILYCNKIEPYSILTAPFVLKEKKKFLYVVCIL